MKYLFIFILMSTLSCATSSEPDQSLNIRSLQTSVSMKSASVHLVPVDPNHLVVMSGHLRKYTSTRFLVRDNIRCSLDHNTIHDVEISFIYEGPADHSIPLTSGEMRRQIGLKIRAHDTCNIGAYVMWHLEPNQGIYVAVKSNPGMSTNEECRDGGYIPVKPTFVHQPNPIVVGIERTLQGSIEGNELSVFADNKLVWRGVLPPEAFVFDGPVGIRTDNGNFDMEIRVQK